MNFNLVKDVDALAEAAFDSEAGNGVAESVKAWWLASDRHNSTTSKKT